MRILVFEDLAFQAAIYNIPIKTLTKYRGIVSNCCKGYYNHGIQVAYYSKAGSDLMDRLIHDFEREILLAEAFASREDPMETVYHRTTAEMIHKRLKTLESIKK